MESHLYMARTWLPQPDCNLWQFLKKIKKSSNLQHNKEVVQNVQKEWPAVRDRGMVDTWGLEQNLPTRDPQRSQDTISPQGGLLNQTHSLHFMTKILNCVSLSGNHQVGKAKADNFPVFIWRDIFWCAPAHLQCKPIMKPDFTFSNLHVFPCFLTTSTLP